MSRWTLEKAREAFPDRVRIFGRGNSVFLGTVFKVLPDDHGGVLVYVAKPDRSGLLKFDPDGISVIQKK